VAEGLDFAAVFLVLETALAMALNSPQEGIIMAAIHHVLATARKLAPVSHD
jgi:hypothetical protein